MLPVQTNSTLFPVREFHPIDILHQQHSGVERSCAKKRLLSDLGFKWFKGTTLVIHLGAQSILSKQEAVRFEIEMFQIELLDVKGERREQSMRAYRKLVKLQDRPIYLARTDE